jgi:hypothetical protein
MKSLINPSFKMDGLLDPFINGAALKFCDYCTLFGEYPDG